jgi:transcriptional regulator with XRE-family HTH domain
MSEKTPEVEEEVRRYAALLKQAIRAAGLSVSEVERRLGTGPKALRRIFSGHVDLKLKHVIAILRILGLSQEQFFALAAPSKRQQGPVHPTPSDFLSAFHRAGFHGDMTPVDEVDPASPEEFDRLVEEAVNRALERRRLAGKAMPEARGQVVEGDREPDS